MGKVQTLNDSKCNTIARVLDNYGLFMADLYILSKIVVVITELVNCKF